MKKKMIILLAAAMMTLASSSAFAYFSLGDLYVAAYDNSTSTQLVLDLGALSLSGTTYSLTPNASTSFNLSTLGETEANAGNVQVAFYGAYSNKGIFASSDPASTPNSTFGKASTFITNFNSINSTAGTATQLWSGATTGNNGYTETMDSIAPGAFAGYNGSTSNFVNPEVSLTTLTAGASQGIFGFINKSASNPGVLDFTATISDNGSGVETVSIANPNAPATPIPAAAYLLGSGLLGLFGIRRKQK